MDTLSNISFVIPAYNCANTINETIESLLDGNFQDGDELIIVNDGSVDNTTNLLYEIKLKYDHIIIISNSLNKGCPATRNIGINIATNALIFNLDSDNILAPGTVQKLKKSLIENHADVAAFSEYHYFHDSITNVTHKWICKAGLLSLADFLSGPINPGPGGNFLHTKESWERLGGYDEVGKGLHEAWGYTLKHLANCSKFVVVPDTFYYHRYGHESLFVRESASKNNNSLMATKLITPYLDLIIVEDAEYVLSDEGSKSWFDNFEQRPLRLKSGEKGINGKVVYLSKRNRTSFLKRMITGFKHLVLKYEK